MSPVVVDPPRSPKKPSAMERVRNIGVVAHIDSGKTTVTERMLKLTGRIHRIGEVHDGEAKMDFMKEEQERGITIGSAVTNFNWGRATFNLIDTPGHVDFTAEVERSLRVLDGAVLVIDSVAGAQAQSETVNRQMDKYSVARLAFVNKMDRTGANFGQAVHSLRERLKLNAHAIQLPVGEGAEFRGLIDLVRMVQIGFPEKSDDPALFTTSEIDANLRPAAQEARDSLLEELSHFSDELTELLIEEQEVSESVVRDVIRRATCDKQFVPVLLGAALRNRGVPALLDSIIEYLPSPADEGAVVGHCPSTDDEISFPANSAAELGALVFKTVHYPTGDLTFVRVYSGSFKSGESLYNPRLRRNERIGRLFLVHAASREPIEEARAGQIVACMGLKHSATGDTLCRQKAAIVYGAATFAEPVISMAIEPAVTADRDKLGEILSVVAREDPTFHVKTDEETGQTIISGMGELHLEVVVHRLRDEFGLKVATGRPRVAYRQTLSKAASFEIRHVKQTGGSGQFAVAQFEFEPIEGDGIEFEDKITQGKITKEFLVAIEKGLREHFVSGGRRAAPIQGVRVCVVDGKMHDVDSSQIAFYACGAQAARAAEERCAPVLLEPIMRVEATVPEDDLGSVLGDLNSRRGLIRELAESQHGRSILADVPLAELSAYSTTLRSLTSGRGSYSMEPQGYAIVPPAILAKIEKEA